jgi:hypothetical protein
MKTAAKLSFLAILASSAPLFGQSNSGPAPAAKPVQVDAIPRLPNGKPNLSGVWNHPYVPDMAKSTKGAGGMSQEGPGTLPYTPAALAAFTKYDPAVDGDYTGACLPFGYLRSFNAPYPIQLLHTPEYVGFLFEQNNWFHVVPMDRKHADHVEPTWFGDSIANWDGDTLVIDTIGFNGKTRLDTLGHQHSDAMHVTQKIQRIDSQHLQMELTVDDPKTYTTPWKNTRVFALMKPGQELMEYSCEENNRDLTQGHIKLPPGK